jgi:hypothetical protein
MYVKITAALSFYCSYAEYYHVVRVTIDGVLDWILDLLTTYNS